MHRIIIIVVLGFFSLVSFGQGAIKKKTQLSDKVFFGGGFGVQFGSVNVIELSPMIGYKPLNNLYLGTRFTYQYYKVDQLNYSTNIYGGSLFALYNFFMNAAAYAEFESISLETKYFDAYNNYPGQDRFWVNSPLVGGGYVQPLGDRSKIMVLLLFTLNQTAYSPYSNPIVKVNFLF